MNTNPPSNDFSEKEITDIINRHRALFMFAVALILLLIYVFRGEWKGALNVPIWISIAALLLSLYTLFRHRFESETSSWTTALTRLAQVYDKAIDHPSFASVLTEKTDLHGDEEYVSAFPMPIEQEIWLSNLCMALEQIFVAISGTSKESQAAWKRYLKNQLNKPTIRSFFLEDVRQSSDYHKGFLEFACGTGFVNNEGEQWSESAIPKKIIEMANRTHPPTFEKPSDQATLSIRPITKEDLPFWKVLYRDGEVKKQMYALPSRNNDDLFAYLQEAGKVHSFTVASDGKDIAGFTISIETPTRGTFGIVVDKDSRRMGYGSRIMKELANIAKNMGLLTLRADVYMDNFPSIRLLEKSGYRQFIWYEKNLTEEEGGF
jgi:RimJ/RimL family protein N-acetyltransferase